MSMTIKEFASGYAEANPGATQQDVADFLGCSRAYLNQMLNHRKTPGATMMHNLYVRSGGALDLDGWLRHRTDGGLTPEPAPAPKADEADQIIEP